MLQPGQTALVRVKAAAADGQVARDGWAVAEFWAPGRDPEHNPDARRSPDKVFECSFDESHRAWVALVDTSGWEPGDWAVRGYASCGTRRGPARGWGWSVLPLAA